MKIVFSAGMNKLLMASAFAASAMFPVACASHSANMSGDNGAVASNAATTRDNTGSTTVTTTNSNGDYTVAATGQTYSGQTGVNTSGTGLNSTGNNSGRDKSTTGSNGAETYKPGDTANYVPSSVPSRTSGPGEQMVTARSADGGARGSNALQQTVSQDQADMDFGGSPGGSRQPTPASMKSTVQSNQANLTTTTTMVPVTTPTTTVETPTTTVETPTTTTTTETTTTMMPTQGRVAGVHTTRRTTTKD